MKKKRIPGWDDLRILLEVSRQGSVNAASKRLKLDHSTVGRRIDQLETTLGRKLLDRRRDGIQMLPETQELLTHIEHMEWHSRAIDDLQSEKVRGLSTVRIATMEGLASCYLAPRIALLEKFDPRLRIELVSVPQVVNLTKKEADIFLSFFRPSVSGLMSQKTCEFSLALYASDTYLKKHGVPRSVADLQKHRYVGYVEDLLTINAVRWLEDVVPIPDIVFRSTSIIAQCAAAKAGVGMVMLPIFVAREQTGLRRVLHKKAFTMREIWLSVRQEQMYAAPLRSITRFLTAQFSNDAESLAGV